jgi:Zn finger protein HypA/HybF involved in hydrogenase expression
MKGDFNMTKLKSIRFARYQNAVDNLEGWCKTCQKFTGDDVEPDTEDRECEECGEDTVQGAENALVEGLFEISDEDLDDDDQDTEEDDNA